MSASRRPGSRPPGRERALPVGRHLRDEHVEQALGVLEQRRDVLRRGIALEAPGELLRDPRGRRRPHALELALQAGQRRNRRRRDEVGDVIAGVARHRLEQPPVQALEPRRPRAPGQVQRAARRVAQRVRAPREIEQRRDREADVEQVLGGEAIRDHWHAP